jgi:hypothetical protein
MIDELGLSVRTMNCLRRKGIRTKNQLMSMSDEELMNVRGFGKHCLAEVREKLGEREKAPLPKASTITLPRAINILVEEFEKAEKLEHIRNPLAYALYKVWKIADAEVADV